MDSDYWNGDAGRQWARDQRLMDQILEPFGRLVVERAEVPPAALVIDTGCGCGGTTLMVADGAEDATVVGVDISKPMLEVARQRSSGRGNVRFEFADAAVAQPLGRPADRVISRFGVMFFADPVAAFSNIHSWLHPDGRLVAMVWNPLEHNPWLADQMAIVGRHTELPSMDPSAPGPFSLAEEEHTATVLRKAGFSEVSQQPVRQPMRVPGSVEDGLEFALGRGPIARALSEAEESLRSAIIDDMRRLIERIHDGEGTPMDAEARLICATP